MPRYDFLCRACEKEFSKILALSKYEKGGIVCPHCKSKNVEQRWAAFYAVTLEEELVRFESPRSHQRSRNARAGKK